MPAPDLPAVFELEQREQVDDVLLEAARLARRSADEGTLVWARSQIDARTRRGKIWHSPVGNLHCALILRPEAPLENWGELLFVNAMAAGNAIAALVSPMTGLRYRWPNRIMLNELLAGRIAMRYDRAAPQWLALGTCINVAHHPPNPQPEAFNSLLASDTSDDIPVSVEALLEGYARHFLSLVNRWAEAGARPIIESWSARADGLGEIVSFELDGELVQGTAQGVDEQGALLVQTGDGRQVEIGAIDAWSSPGHD